MSYTLTIETTGDEVEVAEGQTILDACLRAGIWLPHACCHGLCATCKIQVTDGEIDHGEASSFALMDFERDEGKALACCARLESDASIEADIEEDPDALGIPVEDFEGVVTRIDPLTPTIRGVHVALNRPIRFQAGQYVNLTVGEEGVLTRAFSLASDPHAPDAVELNIRIVPGGVGTTWIHEHLKEGDRVKLSGPYGRFFVRHSAKAPLLFLAGGSGLSSPRSMILDLIARNETLPITLVYGARSREELYYHEEFEALAAAHANFRYIPALSDEPADSGWTGFRGYVHEAARAAFDNDFRGHKAYLCGPPVMIEACLAALMQGRLFEKDIYTEKFFSAADAQQVRSPLFRRI
ncbi:2Fe-2S iron-sulfur cluster binding domain-containing protein [Sphingobium indicum]|uniref:Phenol hydroxylase n=2 Tax=Sphingobium indicum TaxID=332055 RepID=A0A1L5BNI1_SPHIB|nr:phenol 2-monooxygenase domain-containing protein [Sphingobium indicum]APL94490.1 phenol hydroxylase [Sphingobium indicum B90A]KEY97728.1 phenol hydroxylase [Sphingomonas sp. BHC-A]NYI23384.1 phenol hydroxylase P5 protein [Sphingobium indicum]RYM04235.1 2Fe-2S iron-sulfur cluster binding domain-containing protein [Sphingobium indicum]